MHTTKLPVGSELDDGPVQGLLRGALTKEEISIRVGELLTRVPKFEDITTRQLRSSTKKIPSDTPREHHVR